MSSSFSIGSTVSSYTSGLAQIGSGNDSAGVISSEGSGVATPIVSQTKTKEDFQTTSEMIRAESRGKRVAPGDEFLIRTIEKANKALGGRYTTLEFSVHEKTKQISVKVLDKDTGELIREIPPEKTLDMVARLWEMAGILIDEKR